MMKKALILLVVLVVGGILALAGAYTWYRAHRSPVVHELPPVTEYTVTFPEGWRTEEMALRLKESGVLATAASYLTAAAGPVQTLAARGITVLTGSNLTGFLFPDTYRFLPDTDPDTVVAKQVATFLTRTDGLMLTYDDVILASIVEREAKFDDDRAAIAGVYANRLKIGMGLQADPTVQYALANTVDDCTAAIDTAACAGKAWWRELTRADINDTVSPYNTYKQAGLPPTPICNPGLASLKAAAEPAAHGYYYFVTDKDGHAHFAATLAEHNRNVATYR